MYFVLLQGILFNSKHNTLTAIKINFARNMLLLHGHFLWSK